MTICIAATCEHEGIPALVLCTDTRAEKGLADIFLSELKIGSEDADKVRHIGKDFAALVAGQPTKADELLAKFDDPIFRFERVTPNEDSDIVITSFLEDLRKAARDRKREIVEHYVGMNTAFSSFDDFASKGRAILSDSHCNRIWEDIRSIGLVRR
jgi:hypothetical protein